MIKQGEIYWVFAKDLDIQGHEQEKSRPYVIVSRDHINNQGDRNVVGVPLSTKVHKANSHRILIPAAHMIRDVACTRPLADSVAPTDHIRVLDRTRFELPKMGRLSDTALGGLELSLVFLFDIR
jgi:mRNA-degrading endonuclease toxin of MazEF toxin-antitoxin module